MKKTFTTLCFMLCLAGITWGAAPTLDLVASIPAEHNSPRGSLARDGEGNFYGVSISGGAHAAGSIFKMTPQGVFTDIYSFDYSSGYTPMGSLIRDNSGNFYGTTYSGGIFGRGTIFKLDTQNTLTTLVDFSGDEGDNRGAHPQGSLMLGKDGNLYGMTNSGGAIGYGTLFKMTPEGVITTLKDLGLEAAYPEGGLIQDKAGNFYGMTSYSNTGAGTVFKMTPSGEMTLLVAFTGNTGAARGHSPVGNLTWGPDGSLYGMTHSGGSQNMGTIFKVTTTGVFTSLHEFEFPNAKKGSYPYGSLTLGRDGYFYGMTSYGGNYYSGTVFKMAPGGKVTNLVDFVGSGEGAAAGSSPYYGQFVTGVDGNLYGTTTYGGTNNAGTVIRVNVPPMTVDLVTSMPVENRSPYGSLTLGLDNNFYGNTIRGGLGLGTIFKQTPEGAITTLVQFTGNDGENKGSQPVGALVQDSNGDFYGSTFNGGANDMGTLFKMTPAGVLETLVEFTDDGLTNKGRYPIGALNLSEDGYLYGITHMGGTDDKGTIFKMSKQGVLQTLLSFSSTLGSRPVGGLTLGPDGNFYGMTSEGSDNTGIIFKITPAGSLTTLVEFKTEGSAIKGALGYSNLILGNDGLFYGMTAAGGENDFGTIFKMTLEGQLTTLVEFGKLGLQAGRTPTGSLTQGKDGNFYGMTRQGGTAGLGTIFQMLPDGVLTTLVSFTGTGLDAEVGAYPYYGQLTADAKGDLYGMTSTDGANLAGIIFRVNLTVPEPPPLPTLDLFTTTGAGERGLIGPLTLGKDGALYGMSNSGGMHGVGTVYKVTPTGTSTLVEFTGNGPSNKGAYPMGQLTCDANGDFYGMTPYGGEYGYGTIFKMTPTGLLTTLINFTDNTGSNDGANPFGSLTLTPEGTFYGMTYGGGESGSGTIFKMTATGELTTLVHLTFAHKNPYGSLTLANDGNFYGMSTFGSGTSGNSGGDFGTIFKMTPEGDLTTLVEFNRENGPNKGSAPYGSLTLGNDGALYGMTYQGGQHHYGTLFKVTTSGVFSSLVEFTHTGEDYAGAHPLGSLTQGGDGNFYGMTQYGGQYNTGTVFQLTPTGVFTTLLDLGSGEGAASGSYPSYTQFTAGADGNLYGTTEYGGPSGYGTIIRINLNAPQAAAPVIAVKGNNNLSIPHDHTLPALDQGTDFGQVNVETGSAAQSFTITNSGAGDLTLGSSAVTVTGTDFTVTAQPGSTVAPAGTSTFEITFDPATPGLKTATVTIASNDAITPAYTFTVAGAAIDAPTLATSPATLVKGYTATLNGSVNPNGLETSYSFTYGTTPGLTTGGTSTTSQILTASYDSTSITADLSSLLADTTYYYQLTATNTQGSRTSSIGSFTTGYPVSTHTDLAGTPGMVNGGTIYRPLPGVINNAGRILFQAVGRTGSGTAPLVSAANDEWLMSDASGSPRVILREGDQLSTGHYFSGLFNHILLGQSGQSFTSEKIAGATTTKDYAYLAVPTEGNYVDLISQEGDTAPQGGVFINSVGKPALDNQERLYFQGGLSGVATTRATGVWYDNGEGLSPLVQAGENLTSVTGDRAWLGKVSNILAAGGNGASFVAALQANPAKTKEKTAAARNQAIISANVGEEGVELSVIARKGDAVSGGSTLSSITAVSRGVNEHHAFIALMKTGTAGVTKTTDQILAAVVAGSHVIIAREGITILESGLKAKSFGNFHVTANGDVIFQAVLNGAPATSDGILCKWVAATRSIVKLAREGDVAPGTGGLTYGTIHTVGVSDNGNVVLQTILSSGKHALHRNTGSGFVFVVKAGPTDTINFGGTPRPILSIGLYNKTTSTGGGGGGMGSAINDKGDVFTVLSIGGGNYITRIYRGQENPLPPS